jgi:hypothetical protein
MSAPIPAMEVIALATRVRGEYREMPGLCLTFKQACRLWQMDPFMCEIVLQTLVADQSLGRTAGGAFIALPPLATVVGS